MYETSKVRCFLLQQVTVMNGVDGIHPVVGVPNWPKQKLDTVEPPGRNDLRRPFHAGGIISILTAVVCNHHQSASERMFSPRLTVCSQHGV